jgi:hypothetical protein
METTIYCNASSARRHPRTRRTTVTPERLEHSDYSNTFHMDHVMSCDSISTLGGPPSSLTVMRGMLAVDIAGI